MQFATSLLVMMANGAFPNPSCAMVMTVVVMVHTHLLPSVKIVLVTIFSSVRSMAERFVVQLNTNAMAMCIAMVQQTN